MCFELTIRRVLGRCQFSLLRVFSTCGWAWVLSFALAGAGVLADDSLDLDWDPGVDHLAWESFIPDAGTKSFSASAPPSPLENSSSDEGFDSQPIVPATVAVGVIRNTPIANRTEHGEFPILIREPCVCPKCVTQNCRCPRFWKATYPIQIFNPESPGLKPSSFLVDRSVCLAQLEQLEEAGESPAEFDTPSWISKPMNSLGVDIAMPPGDLPESHTDHQHDGPCDPQQCNRGWPGICYYYAATGLYYNPLYFEEVNLERFGYGCPCCLQPAASAAHFFACVPALPCLMCTNCPWECNYALGHYRPGSCVPWRRNCVRPNGRRGFGQAGAGMGMVFPLP
jgi:hypothetical protein